MATVSVSPTTRLRLLAGESVAFAESDPDAERIVHLSWIAEAARAGVKIDIENAVFVPDARLDHVRFARDVRLSGCRFEGFADFSYARFEHKVDLSTSEFKAGASFDSVSFGSDVVLAGARFDADGTHREIIFNDCKVAGVLDAQNIRFGDGVAAQFPRAEFRSSAFFERASFGGPALFIAAQVAGVLAFGHARFAQGVDASHVNVGKLVYFGDARCALGASIIFTEADLGSFNCERALFGGNVIFAAARLRASWGARGACFLRALDLNRMEVAWDIALDEARIGTRGWLAMEATIVRRRLSVSGAHFRSIVDLAGCAVGENLVAQGTRFQTARFGRLKVSGDARFDSASFESRERVDFTEVAIAGTTHLENVSFQAGVSFHRARLGDLIFTGRSYDTFDLYGVSAEVIAVAGARFQGQFSAGVRTAIDLSAATAAHLYCDGAWFRGDVTMIGLEVGSQLSFNDVIVAGDIDLYELTVERGMFVWRSRFLGAVKLETATVQTLELGGSVFRKWVSLTGSKFRAVTIGLDPRDKRPTVCRGRLEARQAEIDRLKVTQLRCKSSTPSDFSDAVITGAAMFIDVVFGGGASFASTRFRGEARFIRVRFHGAADFRGARFEGNAMFRADFEQRADFAMARFASFADFGSATDAGWRLEDHIVIASSQFVEIDLSYAELAGDVQLQGASIRKQLDLRQCVIGTLLLPKTSAALPDRIDLRGCRYGHIDFDLAALTSKTRLQPHSTQPYADLERVLRKMGDADTADAIHLAGCRAERRHRWKTRKGAWLSSLLYWGLANYGVRPIRLAVYSIILVGIFTFYFSHVGTLEHAPVKGAPPVAYDASVSEAFGVSLREFFPVELPILENIVPGPVDWPASILKFFGLILVPVGLAAMTGFLRRQERS